MSISDFLLTWLAATFANGLAVLGAFWIYKRQNRDSRVRIITTLQQQLDTLSISYDAETEKRWREGHRATRVSNSGLTPLLHTGYLSNDLYNEVSKLCFVIDEFHREVKLGDLLLGRQSCPCGKNDIDNELRDKKLTLDVHIAVLSINKLNALGSIRDIQKIILNSEGKWRSTWR